MRKQKSPCINCKKRLKCFEICDKLEKQLPQIKDEYREIFVDPARLEKYLELSIKGISPDKRTQRWLDGEL